MNVKKLVKRLVKKYETNDPFALCGFLGITVKFSDLVNVRGMYQHELRKKIVHINSSLEPHVQRQVCAHELGHALLHKKINTVFWDTHTFLCTDKLEMEANMFAAELLIGDSELFQCEGYSMDQVACTFGVQERLVEYKIKNRIY